MMAHDRTTPKPPTRGYRSGTFTLWPLALVLLAALAHAQPTHWESYQIGSTTYYSGTDANGGQWTGKSYEQWGTRFSEFDGPRGQKQHCRSWQQGGQTKTECDR
jgi:hypothetical protein